MSKPTTNKPPDDLDPREATIIERLRFEDESIDAAYARYITLRNRGVNLDYLDEDDIEDNSTDELDSEIPIVGMLSDGAAELIEESRQRDENVLSGH